MPGGLLAMVASMESITASEAYFSFFNSAADFTSRWRSITKSASTQSASGKPARSTFEAS